MGINKEILNVELNFYAARNTVYPWSTLVITVSSLSVNRLFRFSQEFDLVANMTKSYRILFSESKKYIVVIAFLFKTGKYAKV